MKYGTAFLGMMSISLVFTSASGAADEGPEEGQTAIVTSELDVTMGESRIVMRAANYPEIIKLADGSLVVSAHDARGSWGNVKSLDGGNTWKPCGDGVTSHLSGGIVGRLPNGTVLGMAQRPQPVADQPGTFVVDQWATEDDWETVTGPTKARITGVPELAEEMYDDGGKPLQGPVFYGEFIALDSGELLAPMYTKFRGDDQYRCYLTRSVDDGERWTYVSSIASMDDLTAPERKALRGQEGFCEPALAALPNGDLICAMRTGTYVSGTTLGDSYHDLSVTILKDGKYITTGPKPCHPIRVTKSRDGGKTWSKPVPADAAVGAAPRMLTLSNGVLALAYGRLARPAQGDAIVFSADGGETWTEPVQLFDKLSSGYTGIAEVEPNKIVYVFDSVTAWGPTYGPDWIGAVDIEVNRK